MKRIEQKTECDCMVCCVAMLMGWAYEEAARYFPPKAVEETGYRWGMLVPYLRANGHCFVYYLEDMLHLVDWDRPAMVDVPSLNAPEKGDHVIYWDGSRVIDPSYKENRYTKLPETIFSVVQRKTGE